MQSLGVVFIDICVILYVEIMRRQLQQMVSYQRENVFLACNLFKSINIVFIVGSIASIKFVECFFIQRVFLLWMFVHACDFSRRNKLR